MDIDQIINKYLEKQITRAYSPVTVERYVATIKSFLKYFKEKNSPEEITFEDVKIYMESFKNPNTIHTKINSLVSFYNVMEIKNFDIREINKPKRAIKNLDCISKNILLKKIDDIDNRKHKAFITMAYSTGMRMSEIINLELKDIDFEKDLITVKNSNKKNERILPLSEETKHILNRYLIKFTPEKYLFNGQVNPKYSKETIQCIIKKYIGKECNFQMIRNSNAIELLKSGADIKDVQKHLGHASKKTTKVFEKVVMEVKERSIKDLLPI